MKLRSQLRAANVAEQTRLHCPMTRILLLSEIYTQGLNMADWSDHIRWYLLSMLYNLLGTAKAEKRLKDLSEAMIKEADEGREDRGSTIGDAT